MQSTVEGPGAPSAIGTTTAAAGNASGGSRAVAAADMYVCRIHLIERKQWQNLKANKHSIFKKLYCFNVQTYLSPPLERDGEHAM
jgi:hypothetical protein